MITGEIMKKSMKNTLLIVSMICLSSKSFGGFNDPQMGERYRDIHKKMDICAEVKADLAEVETNFYNMESSVRSSNQKIQDQRNEIRSRSNALSNAKNAYNSTTRSLNELQNLKENQPRISNEAKATIAQVNKELPAAIELEKQLKKKTCLVAIGGRCRDAKRKWEAQEKIVKKLKSTKAEAQNKLNSLKNIDQKLSRANRALTNATNNYNAQKNAEPSIPNMEIKLKNMIAKRDSSFSGYDKLERQYGRLEVRTEKCIDMQFEARKAPIFKSALLTFAADNAQGCEQYNTMLYNARTKAQKQGLREAYELVCQSNVLERVVEVPVEVPGQCNEMPPVVAPICEDSGSVNDSEINSDYVIETIQTNYSTNENGETYSPRTYEQRGVPKLVKVLEERGAVAIKLDIAKIDMEYKYDYLKILDENDNIVYDQAGYASQEAGTEGQIQNMPGEKPVTNFSTGWVKGSKLKIFVYTDGAKNLSGFEINNFQVKYER